MVRLVVMCYFRNLVRLGLTLTVDSEMRLVSRVVWHLVFVCRVDRLLGVGMDLVVLLVGHSHRLVRILLGLRSNT